MTRLTIHTDASFFHHARRGPVCVGGWAAYFRTSGKGAIVSGPLLAKNSSEAEFLGVLAALQVAYKVIPFDEDPLTVFLRCDCKCVIRLIEIRNPEKAKKRKGWQWDAWQLAQPFVEPIDYLQAKYTPGHAGTETKAGWANEICDRHSRSMSRRLTNNQIDTSKAISIKNPQDPFYEVNWSKNYE